MPDVSKRPNILLCGYYFANNTGDDLFADVISETLSRFGAVKVADIMTFQPDLLDWSDILIIGAGSHFTPRGIGGYEHARYAKGKGKKLIFYSLTVEEGHPLLDETLSMADIITVRDSASKKIVEKHGFRAVLASDPIFQEKRRTIGFSFRRWVNEPAGIEDRLSAALDDLAYDYDIFSIPYTPSETDTESDLVFHDKVISRMKHKPRHVSYDAIIEKVDLLIGMRLHALINALNRNKKVLAIDYDAKVNRIFSDLSMADSVVTYDDIEMIPVIVRERIFRIDQLARREDVNEAIIEKICMDMTKKDKPEISVVMPTYNRGGFIKDAIDSLMLQTMKEWELLLIDGGSNDNTKELAASYKDDRIRYYDFGRTAGISFSRNIGNLLSLGEIIAVADSDDINLPDRLQRTCEEMEKTGADIVYASMYSLGEDGRKELVQSQPFSSERLGAGNYLYHPTIAYRRKVAITCPYNEDNDLSEDYDMYLRADGLGYLFHQIEEPLVLYRMHNEQMSQKKSKEIWAVHDRLAELHKPKVKNHTLKDGPPGSVIIEDIDARIGNLEGLVRDKDTHIGNLESHVRNLQEAMHNKDAHIGNLEEALREKDETLHNIYSSHGWKLLLFYYRIRDRLLPAHSRRRRAVKFFWNLLSH